MYTGYERYKYWLNDYNFTGAPTNTTAVNLPEALPQSATGVYTIDFSIFETYAQVIAGNLLVA